MTQKLITESLVLREIKGNDLFGYYEILSDPETMKLFGGPLLKNDIDNKDFVQKMKEEREKGITFFWAITLKEEKEFIGFVRLLSYNSDYYDISFKAAGEYRFNEEFLKYFDRVNGWEIDYALLKSHRNKGIMRDAIKAVLEFCKSEKLSPIYAKVNSMANLPTIKVLKHNNFQDLMKSLNDNKELGMIYKWTT